MPNTAKVIFDGRSVIYRTRGNRPRFVHVLTLVGREVCKQMSKHKVLVTDGVKRTIYDMKRRTRMSLNASQR